MQTKNFKEGLERRLGCSSCNACMEYTGYRARHLYRCLSHIDGPADQDAMHSNPRQWPTRGLPDSTTLTGRFQLAPITAAKSC
eukprot:6372219-Amphidinium_carterae.1